MEYVNNMPNPKLKAFNSNIYFFLSENMNFSSSVESLKSNVAPKKCSFWSVLVSF